MAEALATLSRVATEAPETAEVADAASLAVKWLISGADMAENPNDRIALAEKTLTWDPGNGLAQVIICETYARMENAEHLRTCLSDGLQGKLNLPEDRLQRVREADRAQLLARGTKEAWTALASVYPNTPEGARASEELRRAASVCYDLPSLKDRLLRAVRGIDEEMSQLKPRARPSTTPLELHRVLRSYEKHFQNGGTELQEAANTLETRDIPPVEQTTRTLLAKAYVDVAKAYEIYALGFSKIASVGHLGLRHAGFYQALSASIEHKLKVAANECRLAAQDASDIENPALVNEWLRSQNSQDFTTYSDLYSPDFVGIKRKGDTKTEYDLARWLEDRRGMFAREFTVNVSDQRIERKPDGTTVVRFVQVWSSASYADRGTKELVLKESDSGMLIVREEQLDSQVLSRN